jgi:hypothetical protein
MVETRAEKISSAADGTMHSVNRAVVPRVSNAAHRGAQACEGLPRAAGGAGGLRQDRVTGRPDGRAHAIAGVE